MQHLPRINIGVVPHKKQRYSTCGDYYEKGGETNFRVSKMCADYEFLVLLHEMCEWYLIKRRGLSIKEIDDFDIAFEKARQQGNEDEPGNDKKAPYYNEHQFATFVETMMANKLHIDWDKYDKCVNSL